MDSSGLINRRRAPAVEARRKGWIMHRTRVLTLLVAAAALAPAIANPGSRASAALIESSAQVSDPWLSSGGQGELEYKFDSATRTGTFLATNSPYAYTAGSGSSISGITPDASGTDEQRLAVHLDRNGQVIADSSDQYQLRGKVTVGGQTYDGVLLYGRPVAFGAQSLATTGVRGVDYFDTRIQVLGGELARFFQPDLYLRLHPSTGSTFTGQFDAGFTGASPVSFVVSDPLSKPLPDFATPEPGPLVPLALGSLALLRRRRRAS